MMLQQFMFKEIIIEFIFGMSKDEAIDVMKRSDSEDKNGAQSYIF